MIAEMIGFKHIVPFLSVVLTLLSSELPAAEQLNAERAISQGLSWLVKQQGDDGHWHFAPDRGTAGGDAGLPNEATGLALLAYLGAGQTLESRTYGLAVRHGADYLAINAIWSDGGADLRGPGGTLASHAIAAFALCELCGMRNEPDADIRKHAQAAVEQSARWQNATGGWGLEPGKPTHIRPTVWQLMLLCSAEECGLDTSANAKRLALHGLHQLQLGDERDAEEGPYFGLTEPAQDPTATALGVYGRLLRDWSPLRPWVAREADYLLSENHAPGSAEGNYFLIEMLFRVGKVQRPVANRWETARRTQLDQLLKSQVLTSTDRGSWSPKADAHGQNSRVGVTAYNLMALEVDYGFRPLSFGGKFQHHAAEPESDLSVQPLRKDGE